MRERSARQRKTIRSRLVQAHQQAPWRVTSQRVGLFLLVLVVFTLVGSIYLSVTSQAATAGLGIVQLYRERIDLQVHINDLRSQLAWLNSASVMLSRAEEMGFQRIGTGQALYVVVPGYTGRQPQIEIPSSLSSSSSDSLIRPIYTQSLWDWMFEGVFAGTPALGGSTQ
jgi:hypothetical protein